MQTRAEIRARIKEKLHLSSNSTFKTDDQLNDLIKDAELWAYDQAGIESKERARLTQTTKTGEILDYFYDYPSDGKTNSIINLTVDGEPYDKKNFEDFLQFRKDNPTNPSENIFADYGRQYFIHPVHEEGLDIVVHLECQTNYMTDDAHTTLFTGHADEKNEAIVEKVISEVKNEGENGAHYNKALRILGDYLEDINDQNYRNQHTDNTVMFEVPDYFA